MECSEPMRTVIGPWHEGQDSVFAGEQGTTSIVKVLFNGRGWSLSFRTFMAQRKVTLGEVLVILPEQLHRWAIARQVEQLKQLRDSVRSTLDSKTFAHPSAKQPRQEDYADYMRLLNELPAEERNEFVTSDVDRVKRVEYALTAALATTRGWIAQGCPSEAKGHVLAALERVECEAVV